ncbi:unnamed protein product [Brassica oleracea]
MNVNSEEFRSEKSLVIMVCGNSHGHMTHMCKWSFVNYLRMVPRSLSAEGLALREAVLRCKRMEIPNVCCKSDSLQLIQAVNSVSPISELYSIVADIHSCLASFDFIIFRWIPRMRNVVADNLAKTALSDAVVLMALT